MADICPTCGKQIVGLDREIRLKLPQPVVDAMHDDPGTKRVGIAQGEDFVSLDNKHFFVRVLLPVQLDIGHEFRFGVWMSVDEDTARHLWEIWNKPEYETATFSGHLASLVPPWNEKLEGNSCTAMARDRKSLPFIFKSDDLALSKVLETPWSVHECESVINQAWG